VALAVEDILQDPGVKVVPQSRESFLAGLKLYRDRPDKGYSLTDCISMQIMRREGLSDVLTNDRHFEQEGFRALFRDS
jgi:predicted nucleic acid-binding protein